MLFGKGTSVGDLLVSPVRSESGKCRICQWMPEDLGRKHEAIIRVNSQSGKGGIAWLVQQEFDLDLPLALEIDFTRVVQDHATATGLEVSRDMIRQKFEKRYLLSQVCGTKQGDKDLYVSFVHLSLGKASSSWGVGMHHDPVRACVKAVLKASWNLKSGSYA